MQTLKKDYEAINNDSEPINNDSSFAKEIDSLNNKDEKKHSPLIEALTYISILTVLGILFYKVILPIFVKADSISKFSGIYIFAISFICTIIFCCLFFSEKLISTKTYEVFDIIIESPDNILRDKVVYFSYINMDQKLIKDKINADKLLRNLYISNDEKSYIQVENWGCQGKIKKEVITKFICSKSQYEEFKKSFYWDKALTNW